MVTGVINLCQSTKPLINHLTYQLPIEYFQPMYEEIVKAIMRYKNGYDVLGNLLKIKDKNFIPKAEMRYKYIELANISINGNVTGFTEALGKELPTRARRKAPASSAAENARREKGISSARRCSPT